MAFNKPTLIELIQRATAQISANLGGNVLRRSNAGVIARVIAGMSHMNHEHIEWAKDQSFVQTADGEFLDRHGELYGLSRKAPSYSILNIAVTGTPTTSIPVGTQFKTTEGLIYDVTTGGFLDASGNATIEMTAQEVGPDGNLLMGDIVQIVSPIAGINQDATVSSTVQSGSDLEIDDDYRARILLKKQNPPMGGAESDYLQWALEAAGANATRAWVYPLYLGQGTVGVTFVNDNSGAGTIIPTNAERDTMQTYLDSVKPVTASVIVFIPNKIDFDITIEVTPNSTAVQDAIKTELEDFLFRESAPSETLYLSRINEAISQADGEFDHNIVSIGGIAPQDLVISGVDIYELGAVTFV